MNSAAPKTLRRSAGLLRRDTTAGARRAVFRLVTPEVARDGIVLLPEGIDLTAHRAAGSPFIWGHDTSDPDNAIGRIVEYRQGPNALDIVVEFADDGEDGLATRCWRKVQAGLINSVSVNAAILKSEKRQIGGRIVEVATRSELQEASLVIVGADRGAVRLDRAAVLRALDNLKETPRMDKAELAKTLGIGEDADREMAEAACMKYLAGDDETKQAVIKALDEFYPEPAPAAGEPAERTAGGADDETKTEVEALRAANAELTRALKAAQAAQAAAPKPEQVAAETVKREAKIAADVDRWIEEGRVQRSERAKWIADHRSGKAASVVRHIPAGTWTAGPRLAETGAPVEMPAAPASETRTIARGLVQQARSLDRNGAPKTGAGAAVQQTETRSTAKELIADALTLGRGR